MTSYIPNDREKYITAQLMAVCPVPAEQVPSLCIKIHSEHGETNWLNINPDTLRKIEVALLEAAVAEGEPA